MKLYRISQEVNNGYDTYDKAIVAAPSEEAARIMHPGGETLAEWDKGPGYWAYAPEQVKVELIGTAAPNIEQGVICASFNAG